MRKTFLLTIIIIGIVFISSNVFAVGFNGLGIQTIPEIDPFSEYDKTDGLHSLEMPAGEANGFTLGMQEDGTNIPIGMAIILNLLPSFGVGSFMQGNVGGGLLQLVLEGLPVLGGVALIFAGSDTGSFGGVIVGTVFGMGLIIIGVSIGWTIGIIAPIVYAASNSSSDDIDLFFTGDGLTLGFHF
jgi:hypothetical protein